MTRIADEMGLSRNFHYMEIELLKHLFTTN